VGTIKRFRIVLLGALVLAMALLIARKPKEPGPERFPFRPPIEMIGAMPAAVQTDVPEDQAGGTSDPARTESASDQSSARPVQRSEQDTEAEEDSEADSTEMEMPELDLEEAREEAMAEIRQFDEELAATLWTFNPNARKARLKAAELKDRAESIEQWVQTQDNRIDWAPEDRREWEAQRDIWLSHSSELKAVSQRLAGTRGTRRKVRNIAREMKDRLRDSD
jgi:hypothetical protein